MSHKLRLITPQIKTKIYHNYRIQFVLICERLTTKHTKYVLAIFGLFVVDNFQLSIFNFQLSILSVHIEAKPQVEHLGLRAVQV